MKKKSKSILIWFLIALINVFALALVAFIIGTVYVNFTVAQVGESNIWFSVPFFLATFFTIILLWILNLVLLKVFKKKPITWV